MARQERAARRAAIADRQAERVIATTTTRVQTAAKAAASPGAGVRAVTTGAVSKVDLAAECRRLRDEQGMAWWAIGKALELPGAGDSAVAGKAGAHQARRLYASTGAEVPRTRAPRNGGAKKERGPAGTGSKTERKIALTEGRSIIPEDYDDEQVVAYVATRWIEWGANMDDLDGKGDYWTNYDARVHPTDVVVEDGRHGRALRFREFLGYDDYGKPISGPTRVVYVHSIHTVR